MASWHRAEVEKSWLRHANEDAKKKGEKENGGGEGGSRTDTAVDERRKQSASRVARYQCDSTIWNLRYLFAAPESEFELDFDRAAFFFVVVRLGFCLLPSFFLGEATAATLKSEVAVDGNRKEVAYRAGSLQARLGNRARKLCCCSCFPSVVRVQVVCFLLQTLFLSFFLSFPPYLPLLSFLLRADSDDSHAPHSSKAYATHGIMRQRTCKFLCSILAPLRFPEFVCSCPFPGGLFFFLCAFVLLVASLTWLVFRCVIRTRYADV